VEGEVLLFGGAGGAVVPALVFYYVADEVD